VTRHSTKIRSLTLDQPQEVTVKRLSPRFAVFATLAVLVASAVNAQTPAQKKDAPSKPETAGLGGTSWQLVKFQSMDDKTLIPDDKAKYTLEFGTDGGISARIDCNRGRSTWKSSGPGQLELGPLVLTRAMCPPGSLHDHIVKNRAYVRSYVLKDGHLFLSLMADAGIYELEPITPAKTPRLPTTGSNESHASR
jgi:heat shock protein HslJ